MTYKHFLSTAYDLKSLLSTAHDLQTLLSTAYDLLTLLSTAYDLITLLSTAYDLLTLLTTSSNLQKHNLEVLSLKGQSSFVGLQATLPAFLCTAKYCGGHTVSERNQRAAVTAMDWSKRHVSGAWDSVIQRGVADHRDIVNGCRLKLRGMLELGN